MAYIERTRRGGHRQVFCEHPECWVYFEGYDCKCPDTGSQHATAKRKPCPELVRRKLPAVLIGAVRCTTCGLAVDQRPAPSAKTTREGIARLVETGGGANG